MNHLNQKDSRQVLDKSCGEDEPINNGEINQEEEAQSSNASRNQNFTGSKIKVLGKRKRFPQDKNLDESRHQSPQINQSESTKMIIKMKFNLRFVFQDHKTYKVRTLVDNKQIDQLSQLVQAQKAYYSTRDIIYDMIIESKIKNIRCMRRNDVANAEIADQRTNYLNEVWDHMITLQIKNKYARKLNAKKTKLQEVFADVNEPKIHEKQLCREVETQISENKLEREQSGSQNDKL